MNGVFNLPQAARYLGVSQTHMLRLLDSRIIPSETEPRGMYRRWIIRREDLDDYSSRREYDPGSLKPERDDLPVSKTDYLQRGYEHRRPMLVTRHEQRKFPPVDDGVRCCECGAVVYNAPQTLATLRWRCTACSAAAQRRTAATCGGYVNDITVVQNFSKRLDG